MDFNANVTFYSDEAQFNNDFRPGETLLGVAGLQHPSWQWCYRPVFGYHRNGSEQVLEPTLAEACKALLCDRPGAHRPPGGPCGGGAVQHFDSPINFGKCV